MRIACKKLVLVVCQFAMLRRWRASSCSIVLSRTAAQGYARCGGSFQETMIKFGVNLLPEVFASRSVHFDLQLGYATFDRAQFAINLQHAYVVDDEHARVNSFALFNFT